MEQTSDLPTTELLPLLREARALLDVYQRGQADEVLTRALGLVAAKGLLQQSAPELQALHELACETAFLRNDYARALQHGEEALAIALRLGDKLREALALSWTGAALTQMSHYAEALDRLHAAIELLRTLGQEPLACRALNYLAIVHEELGDVPKALATYERSAEMARLANDQDMLGRALSNLGEAYVTLKRPQEAHEILLRALEVVEPRGDLTHLAWCRLALARLELDAGNEEGALRLLVAAVPAAEQSGAGRTLAEVLSVLGALRARRGEREEALQLLQRSLDIFRDLGIQREIFRTHLVLSEALERLGDFRDALQHHKEFSRVRAEVVDDMARSQLARLTSRYELERAHARQEIERLRNVELAAANARLAEQALELRELSRRDGLTGLLNRRHLDERIAEEFDRARRYGSPLSVAMADLDLFKAINDSYSHAVGDEVLRRIAALFSNLVRKVDVVARYGGEEFALIFPETPLPAALIACEKLRAAVEGSEWAKVTAGLHVTVSLGVARASDLASWEALLAAADARLYEAKHRGRNQVAG